MFYGEDRSFHEPSPPLSAGPCNVCEHTHALIYPFTAYPIGVPIMRVFLYRCANDTIDFLPRYPPTVLFSRSEFCSRGDKVAQETRKGIVKPKGTIKRFVATRRDPHKVRRLPAFESDAWGQCDRVPSETEDFSTDFQTFCVPRHFSLSPVAEHRLSGRLFRYIWQTFEARYAILAHFAGRTCTPTKRLCRSTPHGVCIQLLSVSFSFFHLSLSFENGPFLRPSIAI